MALREGGSTAVAFSSGMAAITAVFEGHATEGRIVVPDDMYFGIRSLIDEMDIGKRFEFVPSICAISMPCVRRSESCVYQRNRGVALLLPRRRYSRRPGYGVNSCYACALLGCAVGRDKLMAYQASARGGWLACELTDVRVILGGTP